MNTTLACMTVAVLAAMPPLPVHAATDRKIVHGSICQPENPADAAKLRYTGRGLHAKDADVELVCPIVRDSTSSGLSFVQARFQRSFDSDDQKVQGAFSIELLSCSDVASGNACRSITETGGLGENPTSAAFTVFGSLPMDKDRAFVIKTKLPKGAVLKSITYTEKVQ